MISKKNILITGVNGFIGSHLAFECLKREINVIGIDIHKTSITEKIIYCQMDLYLNNIVELLKKYELYAIIHCAGMADVNYSINHPDRDFEINVIISRKILYAAKEWSPKTKFLFLSSAAVYGNPTSLPIIEKSAITPISPYGLHKAIIEKFCQYFVEQVNMDVRVLRIFSAYGNGLKKQIFWDMGQKIYVAEKLEMFGTGRETRDFIHINDLINAIFLILEAPKENDIFYNVANGVETSIRKVAEIFCDMCGKKKDIIIFNNQMRTGNPINWCADISKLKKLGYKQTIEINKGIEHYVEWLKNVLIVQ